MTHSTVVNNALWVEKYRPQELSAVALDAGVRQVLASYQAAGDMPHLLLVGPPGCGKTTVARILVRTLDCACLALNASAERGIDTVRDKIGQFVGALTLARLNVVFLDEADQMTADAQTALRNMMEAHAERARFILTANYEYRIIPPIQSRCQVLRLGRPPLKERVQLLRRVLEAEGITATTEVCLGYATQHPDLRQMLYAAQRQALAAPVTAGSGERVLGPAAVARECSGAAVLALLEQRNWTGLRRLAASDDFDAGAVLRDLFWAVPDTHPSAGLLRERVGRAVHETGFTPDPVVLFLGAVAGIMEAL
jgi:replication factor C small subunit